MGWRDQISLSPETIAEITGRTTATGLNPAQVGSFANELGLVAEAPQSYSQAGFRQLLEDNGPLWVGTSVPSLHVIVVTGIYNDGPQLYVRVTDPWDRAVGTPGAPGSYANSHVTGSRYILKWEDFVAEYEAAATNFSQVNLQILHSGGTNERQPNRGGSTPPGYAQSNALNTKMPETVQGLTFAASASNTLAPMVQLIEPTDNSMMPIADRWHTLTTENFAAERASLLATLPNLAAIKGWTIGVGNASSQSIAMNNSIGSGIGIGSNAVLFRYSPATAATDAELLNASPIPLIRITIVSGATDTFNTWSRTHSFTSEDPSVPAGAILINNLNLPLGISFLMAVSSITDIGLQISSIIDTVQSAHHDMVANTPVTQPAAQAFDALVNEASGLPAFPPPGVKLFRSQTENNGINYDLFLMDGSVLPQMPAQVAQNLLPGEQIVLADWPYIDGPSGRSQGGVAIDWSYGAGTVANVRVTPSAGQVYEGWQITVHADIGSGPFTATETQLKVTIRTTFTRNGEANQMGVSDIILTGSGQHHIEHREEVAGNENVAA